MRKNRMMRVASALMVAVLLTTCVISSTFAKYVTEDNFTDNARVAKWGVKLQIVGNLYGDTYADGLVKNNDAGIAVQASNAIAGEGDDIVAPGTKNENGINIALNGTPEVDGTVDIQITTSNVFLAAGTYGVMIPVKSGVITETNFDEYRAAYNNNNGNELFVLNGETFIPATEWAQGMTYYTLEDACMVDAKYYPVLYTLDGTTESNGTYTQDTMLLAAKAIMQRFGWDPSNNVEPTNGETTLTLTDVPFASNTNLTDKFLIGGTTLTWEWKFEGQNDGADTILGMLQFVTNRIAANQTNIVKADGNNYTKLTENTDYCLNSTFDITINVEQSDINVANATTTVAP